jgi:CDGSH-type Zn-finger protein
MAELSVQVLDDGPLLVTGAFQLQDGSGAEMSKDEGRPIALCRCGQSEDKPFCDGSHKTCGFSSSVKA